MFKRFKGIFSSVFSPQGSVTRGSTGDNELDNMVKNAGYSYDPKKDIFYSNIDAWQRSVGYCHLYDEASVTFGMIIDCEPIYFNFEGKKWLIELWKGQYDLTTGCEIGIYTTEETNSDIPDVFKGVFYNCASDKDLLEMSFVLKKNGKTLFEREDKHWWLTGFKLGEFSEPSELKMDLSITFKDEIMRDEFLKSIKNIGYLDDEISIDSNKVSFKFDKPHTSQPITRMRQTDIIIQKKNQLLCAKYNDITGPYDNFPDKINAIKQQSPEIFTMIMHLGKNRQLFEVIKKINKQALL